MHLLIRHALTAIRYSFFPTAPPPIVFPTDFCLFQKLKEFTKGWKSSDDDDVICTTSGSLEDQGQEFFYNGIRTLQNHWAKCISVLMLKVTKYHVHILLLNAN